MFLSFAAVRNEALVTLYRATYASDGQEFFTVEDMLASSGVSVGLVFYRKVLRDLRDSGLVEEDSHDGDGPYYSLTAKGWEVAEKSVQALTQGGDPVEGVPASDRVVTLTDNQRNEISGDISELSAEISRSNEAGLLLGDQKDRVQAELSAASSLFQASKVRLGALLAVLATPLRFLAEKFSGSAIGELAKKLLEEIWKAMNS